MQYTSTKFGVDNLIAEAVFLIDFEHTDTQSEMPLITVPTAGVRWCVGNCSRQK